MKAASFARSFWGALLPTAVVFLLWLHLIWKHDYLKLSPPVRPPVWGKSYVAIYDLSDDHSNVDYYLFYTGIFGFGQRIKQADLLLFGTSHVQFGLSAQQLAQKLSAADGRPVKVFNAAVIGSSQDMIGDIVGANQIHDKTTIFDLFALNAPPPDSAPNFILRALSAHDLDAYVHVGKCWTDFWRDWLLDSLLPSLHIGNPAHHGKIILRRRFLKYTVIRDWNNGDAIAFWIPSGPVYPNWNLHAKLPIDDTFHPYATSPNGGIGRSFQSAFLQAQHLHAIYTLLPFDGSNLGIVPSDARPYVPISPEGLYTWDGSHYTGESRAIATERLFEGMGKLGLKIEPASAP